MATRDPTAAVAKAVAEIEETVAGLRRRLAQPVDPWETQRIVKLLDALMELECSTLPHALRAWNVNPSDEAEVWGWLKDWEAAKAIMSPSPCPAQRRGGLSRRG